jgi:hypothetical protein
MQVNKKKRGARSRELGARRWVHGMGVRSDFHDSDFIFLL